MTNTQTLQRLIWKDARLVQPLVLAMLAAILVTPLLIALSMTVSDMAATDAAGVAISFWMLFPNLVALGAPAMLVGTEEDTGTMGWMRTIPVRWQSVATSKLIVGIAAVAIAYLVASGVLWIQSLSWPVVRDASVAPFGYEWLSGIGLAMTLFFSFNLLFCGLITASVLRSPVGGILAVVPVIITLTVYSTQVAAAVLDVARLSMVNPQDLTAAKMATVASMMAACWLVLIIVFYQSVKFRLTSTFASPFRPGILTRSQQAYHPPAAVTGLRRPSVLFALLWQQVRQVRSAVGVLMLIGLLCVWQMMMDRGSPLVIVPMIALSWMGVMTFYGDSVKGRRRFFGEKGISPTLVWATRLLPTIVPATAMVALLAAVGLAWSHHGFPFWILVGGGTAMYCFGVFVSQWSLRPVLAFFGAPAILGICITPLGFWFSLYHDYLPLIGAMGAVVLVASWRLMRAWMDGRDDWLVKLRTAGYLALSVAVPVLITIGHRIATTPSAMPQWQQQTMALAIAPASQTGGTSSTRGIVAGTYPTNVMLRGIDADIHQRMTKELADDDSVGRHVTYGELEYVALKPIHMMPGGVMPMDPSANIADRAQWLATSQRDLENQVLAAKVLTAWANRVYRMVVDGDASLVDLIRLGEPAEWLARDLIARHRPGDDPVWRTIEDELPSDQLRKDARRTAIIAQWKRYRLTDWHDNTGQLRSKSFATATINASPLRYERTRSDRYIDRVVKMVLDEIESETRFADAEAQGAVAKAWLETRFGFNFGSDVKNYQQTDDRFLQWMLQMSRLPGGRGFQAGGPPVKP
jgi:hypothetical protein